MNSLIANDGDPPPFFPLSILLKLGDLSFVVDVFELRVLSFLAVSNGDLAPLPPLSTFLKFQVLSFLAISDGNPPHVFPLSILLELRTLIFYVVSKFRVLSFLVVGDGDPPSPFSSLNLFRIESYKIFCCFFFLSTILTTTIDAPLSSRPQLDDYFQPSSHQHPLDPFPFFGRCSWFFIFVATFFFICYFVDIFLLFVVQLLHFSYSTNTFISIIATFFHLLFNSYISFI